MRKKVNIDWITVLVYIALVVFGWMNIYSTSAKDEAGGLMSMFDLNTYHGKQFIFIAITWLICGFVLMLDTKFVEVTSYIFYGITIALMIVAVFFAKETKGASAWFQVGGFGGQPTEFAKVGTLMALAKFMSRYNFSMKNSRDMLIVAGISLLPMLLALLQNDAGSAITFFAPILMLYREGLHPLFLVFLFVSGFVAVISIILTNIPYISAILVFIYFGIGVISLYLLRWRFLNFHIVLFVYFSIISLFANHVLKDYQKLRIRVLVVSEETLNKEMEEKYGRKARGNQDVGYQLRQSMVAIGSGGVWGKGYGNATHTKGDFVPEEHTDYIFCVVGEEHGWMGSTFLLIAYLFLLWRMTWLAENSKSRYGRIYGYGAASILFIHFVINVGMTIGMVPTIGIPLPYFSYGGSAILSFSLMLFVLVNLHSYRVNILGDKAI